MYKFSNHYTKFRCIQIASDSKNIISLHILYRSRTLNCKKVIMENNKYCFCHNYAITCT